MNSYARQQNAAFRRLAADMEHPAPQQRIASLEAEVARLQYRLELAHERIAQLEGQQTDGASPLSDSGLQPTARGGAEGGDAHPSSLIPSSHWLTLAEAAEKFGVSHTTVWRALAGQSPRFVSGPVIKLGNRRWLLADTCTLSQRPRRGRN